MLARLRPAITLLAAFLLLTGLAYPLAITGIAQLAFPFGASGSLIRHGETVIGSALIGQNFTSSRYFWPRPSVTARSPYDASASGGSNLGPTSSRLAGRVKADVDRLHESGIAGAMPADGVTASGSGLDPHVSPAFARVQVARVASERNLSEAEVVALVERFTEGRILGILGEPRVNVLLLNRALDAIRSGG